MSISASDVIHGAIITHMVIASRNGLAQPCNPLLVLCYLADHVASTGATQFTSFHNMDKRFNEIVQVVGGLHEIQFDFRVNSVDDFVSKFETMRAAIEPNNQISHNNLVAPSVITPDSHLGVFMRTILAKWECLQFEDVCMLHHEVQRFMCAQTSSIDSQPENAPLNVQSPFLRMWSASSYDGISVGDIGSCVAMSNDVAVVEAEVHGVYDLSGTVVHLQAARGFSEAKDGSNGKVSAKSALHAVMNSDATTTATTLKHQHAMLRLAAMWLQVNNLTMALSAVEEALKTAHQRGDHRTISHSLLLLHSVFQHSQDPELVASAEDILMRCTRRSAALDLQHLTAQSALLLASLRAKQPLRAGLASASCAVRDAAAGDQPAWHVREVWSQVAFALLGEIALTRQAVTPAGVVEDSEFTQSGPSTSLLPTASQSAAKKDNLQEAPLAVGPELLQLSLQACLLSCGLWERQGMLHMAEYTCRRGLVQLARLAPAQDIIPLVVRLIYLQVDLLRSSQGHQTFDAVLALAKSVKALYGSAADNLAAHLDGAILYALALRAMSLGDTCKALRVATRLVETTAPLPAPTSTGLRNGHDDTCAGAAGAVQPTEEQVRARLLLAELLGQADPAGALQLLADLEASCRRSGSAQWVCHCLYLRGCILLCNCDGDGDPVAEAAGLGILTEALLTAQTGEFTMVQNLVAKFVSSHAGACNHI